MKLRLEENGPEYIVKFEHKLADGNVEPQRMYNTTYCYFYIKGDDGDLLKLFNNRLEFIHGFANCHPQDRFSKSKGRKIAFTRALKLGGFTRDERTILWNQYFSQCKP